MLPVFTMLNDNLQHLVELSMVATVSKVHGCHARIHYYKMMSLSIRRNAIPLIVIE